jgi:hypothetical protein
VEAVRNKTLTLGAASKAFGVPKTSIYDRLHSSGDKLGRPTVLSDAEEEIITERLLILGRWGFPLTTLGLKQLVKDYLDRQGRTSRFADNMPKKDFVAGFLKRHPELSVRTANLIKRSRAAVSAAEINNFFDRFEKTAAGIPPENLFNFDETNLQGGLDTKSLHLYLLT